MVSCYHPSFIHFPFILLALLNLPVYCCVFTYFCISPPTIPHHACPGDTHGPHASCNIPCLNLLALHGESWRLTGRGEEVLHFPHEGDWVSFLSQYIPCRHTLCHRVDPCRPSARILILTTVGSELTILSSAASSENQQ